jgi:hypothetical protein
MAEADIDEAMRDAERACQPDFRLEAVVQRDDIGIEAARTVRGGDVNAQDTPPPSSGGGVSPAPAPPLPP